MMRRISAAMLGMALFGATPALAQEHGPHGPMPPACKNIHAACESAGYTKDDQKKNLWRDCVRPIMSGKKVEGVNVKSEDVDACKAAHHRHDKPAQ